MSFKVFTIMVSVDRVLVLLWPFGCSYSLSIPFTTFLVWSISAIKFTLSSSASKFTIISSIGSFLFDAFAEFFHDHVKDCWIVLCRPFASCELLQLTADSYIFIGVQFVFVFGPMSLWGSTGRDFILSLSLWRISWQIPSELKTRRKSIFPTIEI